MTSDETQYKWPTKKLKRAQTFEICDFPAYTLFYSELEDDGIALTISKIRQFYSKPHNGQIFSHWDENKKPVYQDTVYPAKEPTEEEIRELITYINKWREDVDDHFKFTNFMLYEWYYPIRNKIYRLWKKR
jgi:hypothetical protein